MYNIIHIYIYIYIFSDRLANGLGHAHRIGLGVAVRLWSERFKTKNGFRTIPPPPILAQSALLA